MKSILAKLEKNMDKALDKKQKENDQKHKPKESLRFHRDFASNKTPQVFTISDAAAIPELDNLNSTENTPKPKKIYSCKKGGTSRHRQGLETKDAFFFNDYNEEQSNTNMQQNNHSSCKR